MDTVLLATNFTWPRPMRSSVQNKTQSYCTIAIWFGLKWIDWTSLEEAAAMKIARAAGMPVSRDLSYGEHPYAPFNRVFSILITRLPRTLENLADLRYVELENRDFLS
ncbi:phosphotransferase family protein [Penicillium hordei]|uniref:Phosphotransferase family protein n=1 Tax=Penicillium hordei TaxID=40994 RepID=A0AAD6EJJ3_9EURO|nr:phosphotransferase family protein [Penicillium hordei]KAJ5617607.1 phosphotransferase family protein [Penicillium hordei]